MTQVSVKICGMVALQDVEASVDGKIKIDDLNMLEDSEKRKIIIGRTTNVSVVDEFGNERSKHTLTYGSELLVEDVKDIKTQLKAHINNYVKAGGFERDGNKYAQDFIVRMRDRYTKAIEKLKTDKGKERASLAAERGLKFIEDNVEQIKGIYGVYLAIMDAKIHFVKKLSKIQAMPAFYANADGSFDVADPEGFVAVDHVGNAVKLVDRLGFSQKNFAPDKTFG